ncbi:hypothetical protein TrST_g8014 [Triparma strigata]|uniref:Tyrosine-protein kinase ephrin type A/B receptor-like domain-containing protein n=1 Tax=Triparma strigata TaxID=1606541 RepID=A0A9W7B8H8_9STRA|nr:hypothetical protein TrST_g8014 [Triparma strigata]
MCSSCPAGYECIGGETAACDAGTYSNGDTQLLNPDSPCQPCEKGYSCPGGTDHSPCRQGSYQNATSRTKCLSCPAGKYQEDPGQDACVDCPAGYFCPERTVNPIACGSKALYCPLNSGVVQVVSDGYYSIGGTEITRHGEAICDAGTFCIGGVKSSCDSNGQYADELGLSACKSSPAGKKPTADRQSIESCPVGRYSSGGSDACTECMAGKFTDVEGTTGCTVASYCPPGHIVKEASTPTTDTVCTICSTGLVSPGGDYRNLCIWCNGEGEYSDIEGGTACKSVPAGYKPAYQHRGLEACPLGSYSTGGTSTCTSCDFGKFAASEGSLACTPASMCHAGTYIAVVSTSTSDTDCVECPPGTSSSATRVQHYAACGGGKNPPFRDPFNDCSEVEPQLTDDHEEIALRCCSDTFIPGWVRRPNQNSLGSWCSIWSESDAWGDCQYSLNYTEAVKFCDSVGARLCTREEVEMGCAEGTGCGGMNGMLVWTSTADTVSTGQYSCSPCTGPGEYSDIPKLASCKTAPAGCKPNNNRDGIVPCEKNTFSIGANSLCTPCPDGGHSNPASSACDRCLTGKYFDEPNNECKPCPKNTFTISGAADINGCEDCPAGGHSQPGAGYCDQCFTGRYYDEPSNECKLCPTGKYTASGGIGIEECDTCIEGFFSSEPGASTCFACQPGQYVNKEHTKCLACSPGKFSGVASPECSECEPGKYAEGDGNSECISCQPGNYSRVDKTGCSRCPAGKISGLSSTGCTSCDAGKYAESESRSECTKCPDYQTSSAGSSTCECKETFLNTSNPDKPCSCAPGTTLENGVCVSCAAGFYKSSTSLDACINCNKFAIKGAVQSSQPASLPLSCICSRGDFRVLEPPFANSTQIGQCKPCPEGTRCQEVGAGVTIEDLPLQQGFWRSGLNSSNVVKCYIKEACSQSPSSKTGNSTNPIDDQCADGHTGPVCNVCIPDYAMSVLGKCETCNNDNFYIPTESSIFMAVLAAILIATIIVYFKRKRGRDRLQQFRKRKHRSKASSSTISSANTLVAAQTNKDHWFYRARTKAKILLSFSQILTSFEGVLEIRFPTVFEKFTRLLSSTVKLDALQLARIDCIIDTDFYTSLITQTLLPICVSVLIFLGFLVAKFANRGARESQAQHADRAWSTFLALTYIVFASVSTTIFDTFNCNKIGDDPHFWLARDHSIDCKSPEHASFKTYASVMIMVYPIGIPLLYAVLLYRSQDRLVKPDRDYDPSISKISFLWQNYDPDKWWFEVFECARRLGMSGVLVFVAQGTASQIVVGILISVITSGLYIHWRPFEKESDDNLAIATQVSLFLTLLAALLKKVEVDKTDNYNELIFGIMLIVINSSAVGMILLSQLTKPIHYLFNSVLGTRHSHDGTLRGMNKEQTKDQQGFTDHFLRVANSSAEEGGWKLYVSSTQKWGQFLDYSKSKVERRCSTGNGAIDETRAIFVVKWDFEKLKSWVLNDSKDLRHGVIETHEIGGGSFRTHKDKKIEYVAKKMKGGLYSDRDYLLECVEGRGEDGGWYLVKRSVEDGELYSLKKSHSQRRVRAKVVYEGWVLHDLGGGEGVRITYVENVDPGGLFKGIIVDKMIPKLLRDMIDDLLAHIEEENEHVLLSEFDENVEGVEMTEVANKVARSIILGGGGSPKNPIHTGINTGAANSRSQTTIYDSTATFTSPSRLRLSTQFNDSTATAASS